MTEDQYTRQDLIQKIFGDQPMLNKVYSRLDAVEKELVLGVANIAFIQGQKEGMKEAREMLRDISSATQELSRAQSRPGDGDMGG